MWRVILVYISISNYKPNGNYSYCLDSLKRDFKGMKALLKNLDMPMVDLHGIRSADVSKLDKSKWIEWQDYRVKMAKSILLRRKADLLRGERRLAYEEHRHEMSHVKSIEGLLANNSLKNILNKSLGKDHDIRQAMIILQDSQREDVVMSTLSQLKKLVHDKDKDWFDKNFSSSYKWKSFDYLCKDISDKYPLLLNINQSVYGWQNLDEQNFGKNIADYISMCDKLGEEA